MRKLVIKVTHGLAVISFAIGLVLISLVDSAENSISIMIAGASCFIIPTAICVLLELKNPKSGNSIGQK